MFVCFFIFLFTHSLVRAASLQTTLFYQHGTGSVHVGASVVTILDFFKLGYNTLKNLDILFQG